MSAAMPMTRRQVDVVRIVWMLVALILGLMTIFPLFWMISIAFKPAAEVFQPNLLPVAPSVSRTSGLIRIWQAAGAPGTTLASGIGSGIEFHDVSDMPIAAIGTPPGARLPKSTVKFWLMRGRLGALIVPWPVEFGQPVLAWDAHPGKVKGVALSATGRLLATAGEEGAIKVWKLEDRPE